MKLIVIESEGVIHHALPNGVLKVADWAPIDGSIEALAALSRAGFTLVVTSHQPHLASGKLSLDELEAIHTRLTERVENRGGNVAGIFYCPHAEDAGCQCRKPNTGLIDAIELEFETTTERILMVGHTEVDIDVAQSTGCTPILVGMPRMEEATHFDLSSVPRFHSLTLAADHILRHYPS